MKNQITALLSAPLSVKFLTAIYLVSFARNFSYIARTEVLEKIGMTGVLMSLAIALVMLGLILARVSWAWKAGIGESIYYVIFSVIGLVKGREVSEAAAKAAMLESKNGAEVTPEQMETVMKIGLYGGLTVVVVGALISGVLWYKARSYFEKRNAPVV